MKEIRTVAVWDRGWGVDRQQRSMTDRILWDENILCLDCNGGYTGYICKKKQTNTSTYTLKMWILLHVNDNSKLIPKKERIGKEKWRRKGRREKKRATTTETKSLQAVGQEQDSTVWH